MRADSFEIDGVKYTWMSIAEMEQDERIMSVNSDIVDFVKQHCNWYIMTSHQEQAFRDLPETEQVSVK